MSELMSYDPWSEIRTRNGHAGDEMIAMLQKAIRRCKEEDALHAACEERRDKAGILAAADVTDPVAINNLLNKQVRAATEQGLHVLYCIGETAEEQDNWQDTLAVQLELGLDNVDRKMVSLAYEPVWAIGPGKTPPDRDYIAKVAKFVKESTDGMPLVYGGGLKVDNAKMLASIPEIDGGLIALTRFTGEIGFYPDEYIEIIDTYMGGTAV